MVYCGFVSRKFGGVYYSGSKQSRLLDLIKEKHLPAISVSKSKNVLLVGYFKLTTVKLICAFRKTVTSACGRCLGRKHLYTFAAVTSDVVVFSSI